MRCMMREVQWAVGLSVEVMSNLGLKMLNMSGKTVAM